MKINTPKMTSAQKRKREATLLEELCSGHGYAFADTLGKNDRTGIIMSRVGGPGGKMLIKAAFYLKLIVPVDGALGKLIAKQRKERDPATSKSARARARANAKTKVPIGDEVAAIKARTL